MRTAILSDLHLSLVSGGDVLRDAGVRRILLDELDGADRVILLGDVVELREMPLGAALERARPFFEDLGEALGDREVTIVPGNHDHRFAEPLLDELSLDGGAALGLEQSRDPSPGPTAEIDAWLGPARLRVAYPGLWVRDDVYAMHGHYMDAHLKLPRAECLAIATMIRLSRPLPASAGAGDYERVLRPVYGFAYAVGQGRSARAALRTASASESAWEVLAGEGPNGRRRKLSHTAIRTGFPAGLWALNRVLDSDFEPDVSGASIFRGGVEATTEVAARLGLSGVHVISGHTHRGGPLADEPEWLLPGGGRLHNTGSWVFSSAFHHPGKPPNPYWPGTVTWVDDDGPPRRVQLLAQRSHDELTELVARASASRLG